MKKFNSKLEIQNSKKGFTLVELIVVMAVFLFVVGAAIGIFISIITSQRKILAEQQVLNQISYVEEYMSKALRMASTDTNGNCLGSGNEGHIYLLTGYGASGPFKGIKFFNKTEGVCQEFFLDGTGVTGDPYILKEIKYTGEDVIAVPITSPAVEIISAKFSVNGSNGGLFISESDGCESIDHCGAWYKDEFQPRVTILLKVKVAGDAQEPIRIFQVTVSQRNLNVDTGQR